MIDLESVKARYERLNHKEIKNLALRPQDLRTEVIPLLQNELINRGFTQDALSLTEYLVNSKSRNSYRDLSKDELHELIRERLKAGESIESIKIDLNDERINVYDIMDENRKFQDRTYDYIIDLKGQGLSEQEINTKLQQKLSIDEKDSEVLKSKLRIYGRNNLILGYAMAIPSLILLVTAMFVLGRFSLGALVFFGIGIQRIFKGHSQLK